MRQWPGQWLLDKCQSVWVFPNQISKLNLSLSQIWLFGGALNNVSSALLSIRFASLDCLSSLLFTKSRSLCCDLVCLRCVFVGWWTVISCLFTLFSFFFFHISSSSSSHVSNAIESTKRNGKLSYVASDSGNRSSNSSSSIPPNTANKKKKKSACTFVWFADTTLQHTHSEVYQFISFFLRWCIGNLIFSSIWKEKCSLYFVRCLSLCASNALKLSFFSFWFLPLLPLLLAAPSSQAPLSPPAYSPCCFLFAVFVTVYLPLPLPLPKWEPHFGFFVSHVLLRFRTFFYRSPVFVFTFALSHLGFFPSFSAFPPNHVSVCGCHEYLEAQKVYTPTSM